MTREEAIQVLKEISATLKSWEGFTSYPQAIDMAIEALSSEQNRPIKVRNDGTLFVKVLDVSKVERVIIGDDKSAFRQDFSKPFSNNITDSQNDVIETKNDVIEPKLYTHEEVWSDDDLVSREDAMGAVQDHFNDDGFKGYDDGQKMLDRIKALPSADRPSGEWRWRGFNIECSVCGNMPIFDSTEPLPNYCSACGAYMKGGTE